MRFNTNATQPAGFQPVDVNLTFETPDDLRWFYHLMNLQLKEIKSAYEASSKGGFDERFRDFTVPDKKDLYRYIKDQAVVQGVDLTMAQAQPAHA